MLTKRLIPFAVAIFFLLPAFACGGSTDAAPTATPAPTATQTPAPAPTPEAAAGTPWSKIVAAYVGPDGNPDDATLRNSFTAIMEAANEVVMDSANYSADEAARGQAIFDAAANAHDALTTGDSATLANEWKSLDTFVALLKSAAP